MHGIVIRFSDPIFGDDFDRVLDNIKAMDKYFAAFPSLESVTFESKDGNVPSREVLKALVNVGPAKFPLQLDVSMRCAHTDVPVPERNR